MAFCQIVSSDYLYGVANIYGMFERLDTLDTDNNDQLGVSA